MIGKSIVKAQSKVALAEKEDIEKDVLDTEIYFHEYLFKRLFFRTILIFIFSFSIITYLKLKDDVMNLDFLKYDILISLFSSVIIYSFAISAIYVIFLSFGIFKQYNSKYERVYNYNKALDFLESKKEVEDDKHINN